MAAGDSEAGLLSNSAPESSSYLGMVITALLNVQEPKTNHSASPLYAVCSPQLQNFEHYSTPGSPADVSGQAGELGLLKTWIMQPEERTL